jgi:hypothetical protein
LSDQVLIDAQQFETPRANRDPEVVDLGRIEIDFLYEADDFADAEDEFIHTEDEVSALVAGSRPVPHQGRRMTRPGADGEQLTRAED